MGRHVRLQGRIAVAVTIGALVVAAGVALLLGNTIKLRNNADATIGTNAYLVALINVERLVVDAETGLRGYQITGRTLFLQPLRNSDVQFPAAAAALETSAAREHAFIPQAQALVAAGRSYLSSYVPSVLKAAARSPGAARSFALTLEGKHVVDTIRARASALESLVSARQTDRQLRARHAASESIAEGIAVLVVLTLLTALLGAVLGRTAVGRERARDRAERTASILQRSLLPRAVPAIPDCDVAVRFRPAGTGELVGGDFYDVFPVGPGRWAIVLGDVCGKGAEAAAVTAMARWTLRSFPSVPEDPAEPLRFVNDALLRQDLDGRFITIAYLLLELEGDRAQVSIACAGHPAPILVPAAGEPVAVGANGTLIGAWPDLSLRTAELQLAPGDALVAYTDGVTDQGPEFRPDTPASMLLDPGPQPSAERLAALVESYADQLRGAQRDDIAIVAVRFRRSPPGDETPERQQLANQAV